MTKKKEKATKKAEKLETAEVLPKLKKRELYLQELNEVAAASPDGLLRAEDVVEYARNPATQLNSCFVWNDKKAGHLHRLATARAIIRIVVTVTAADENLKVRAFVSTKKARYTLDGGGYHAFVTVMTDGDLRRQLLADAYEDMDTFMRKYEGLKELAAIFEAMERVAPKSKRVARAKSKGKPGASKYGGRQPQPSV